MIQHTDLRKDGCHEEDPSFEVDPGIQEAICIMLLRVVVVAALLSKCLCYIAFPVYVDQKPLIDGDPIKVSVVFAINPTQNPWNALREFCFQINVYGPHCMAIRDYLVTRLQDVSSVDIDTTLPRFDDDIIMHIPEQSGPSSPFLTWSTIDLPIDLQQLNGGSFSAVMSLPASETNVDDQITQFCAQHKLKGIRCRVLNFEVRNYLTSLYLRPGGVTLRNILEGMYFKEYLEYISFLVDVNKPDGSSARYYFAQHPTYFLMTAAAFCMDKNFDRAECSAFTQYLDQQLNAYYDKNPGEMWAPLYIMYAINTIIEQHKDGTLDQTTQEAKATGYVDADFIEIGTSDFNTITQLIDDADPLIGFAVEPSMHYLSHLPDKTGVTKVNCAIVPAPSPGTAPQQATSEQPMTVDLYHIPEQVIANMGLPSFLKGCNSIGDYHPLHKKYTMQARVVIDKVPAYTIEQLLTGQKIRRIRLLKIDAEGYDMTILDELYHYILARNDPTLYPERIVFETNDQTQDAILQELLARYKALGYVMVLMGEDTIMERLQAPAPRWVVAV